jgi:threonine/homoserine/homoserine lactone efflux protein
VKACLFALGLPRTVTMQGVLSVIILLFIQSACVNLGYAFLFSNSKMHQGNFKMKRVFDGVFAFCFGLTGIKILMSKLNV